MRREDGGFAHYPSTSSGTKDLTLTLTLRHTQGPEKTLRFSSLRQAQGPDLNSNFNSLQQAQGPMLSISMISS